MSLKSNDIYNEQQKELADERVHLSDYELHLKAGLVDAGIEDETKAQLWIGPDSAWDEYEKLKN